MAVIGFNVAGLAGVLATMVGMALGGWMSGAVFDWTGSYRAAFVNGLAWNLVNVAIVGFLLHRVRRSHPPISRPGRRRRSMKR